MHAPRIPDAETHVVFNQSGPLEGYNLYLGDRALRDAVAREGAGWAEGELRRYGAVCGEAATIELGFLANEVRPQLYTHDRFGYRVDLVKYHPAYHALMRLALGEGLHSSPWTDPRPGAHVARAAKYYLHTQVEAAHCCPVTMTFAAVPTLRATPSVAEAWLPKVLARDYDPRDVPAASKAAVTVGMGMTEKQGGSDVRSNTTQATPLEGRGPGEAYLLTGHKWFLSAPMCDAFLMLAQAPAGLSCFLVPRWRPDGQRNPLHVQRLKNKMGNVANASSEVELRGALGWLVGEEGRGVRTIIEMVALTRFDCMIGSSAGQRQAVAQAVHHAARRVAFGKRLIDQPLMRNVLADLQLEVEGSVAHTLRIAHALDHPEDERERALVRLGTAVGKYWICKRTPQHAYEAMECLGGNGVMEDCIMPRLYREAVINPIWEGSGNVQALDLLRVMGRTPRAVEIWFEELGRSRGGHALLDAALDRLEAMLRDPAEMDYRARALLDQLALTFQAHLLLQAGHTPVAEAFIVSRLGSSGDRHYGTLPRGIDVQAILERADPHGGE